VFHPWLFLSSSGGWRYDSKVARRLADAEAASDDGFGMIAAFLELSVSRASEIRGFLNADPGEYIQNYNQRLGCSLDRRGGRPVYGAAREHCR
jgi:hypothetical protein